MNGLSTMDSPYSICLLPLPSDRPLKEGLKVSMTSSTAFVATLGSRRHSPKCRRHDAVSVRLSQTAAHVRLA